MTTIEPHSPGTPNRGQLLLDTTPPEAAHWPVERYRTAGGVVLRNGKALLLRRSPGGVMQVRLPKGHIERGEKREEAALREVREETGLHEPRIVALLGTVDNRFAHAGKRFERLETWFVMESDADAGDPSEATDEWAWQLDWHALETAETSLTFPAERVALRWALERGAKDVRWAPKLPHHLIRRLYDRDAMGLVDDELIDDVGYRLLSRCKTILAATDAHYGRITCPRCGEIVPRNGGVTDRDLVVRCGACGWATTWRAYHLTYRGKQLFGANAVTAFKAFVDEFGRSHTPRQRMLAIDRLLHAFHQQLRPSGRVLGRPAAANLLEGGHRATLAFLDELTFGEGGRPELAATRSLWQQTRAEQEAQREAHRARLIARRAASD